MKTSTFAALPLTGLLLAAGIAVADTAVVKVYGLDVKERIQTLELIDVTAEKQPAADAEPLDEMLQQILDEAEALELEAQQADDD